MAYLGRQPNTGVRSRYIFTATASQTTFSGSDDDGKTLKYEDAAYLDVFLNGVLLKPVTDYTATSKTSVVLTSGAAASDVVEIVAYDIANIANTVSATNGGTFEADVTVQGTVTADGLTVDTNTLYVDAANNRVGVGNTAPSATLDVNGTIKLDGSYPLGTNNTGLGDTVLESISSGSSNTAIGKNAMNDATTASNNVAVGQGALTSTTSGGKNVALGMSSLAFSTTASNNTASGYQAGYSATTGSGNSYYGYVAGAQGTVGGANVAVGQNALNSNQGGSRNVAIGADALQSFNYGTTVTNTYQVGIGYEALHDATVALQNTAIGSFALRYSTTASYNTSTGYQSSYNTTTGQYNVGNGYRSLYSNTTSSFNTTVGSVAGYSSTGGYNTFLGYGAGYHVSTGSKNTVVGLYNGNQGGLDIRTASNCIVLSDGDGNPRLYINSSGNWVTQGATPQGPGVVVDANYTEIGRGYINICRDDTATINTMTFGKNGSIVGSISTTGSATAYNTSSDYRLKENVVELTGATTRLKQLEPKRFNFIADADTTVDGFLAHEVQAVVPEAIHGTKDEVDDEGNPVYQGIDQSKLVPLLTAALQEAITKIETLETANADMLARITALENA